jgi:hypothetical protein
MPAVQRSFAAARGWRFPMVSHHAMSFAADMGYRAEDGGWLPGVSVFRREAERILRVSDAPFPGQRFLRSMALVRSFACRCRRLAAEIALWVSRKRTPGHHTEFEGMTAPGASCRIGWPCVVMPCAHAGSVAATIAAIAIPPRNIFIETLQIDSSTALSRRIGEPRERVPAQLATHWQCA